MVIPQTVLKAVTPLTFYSVQSCILVCISYIFIFIPKYLGALAFDHTSGFWIVSSVPRFPTPVKDGYKYKDEQTKYGQTILCVSVDKTMEAKISKLRSKCPLLNS